VDIPTVSRWLGHQDGGALCMKTYGHLRDEHSANEARKAAFWPELSPHRFPVLSCGFRIEQPLRLALSGFVTGPRRGKWRRKKRRLRICSERLVCGMV